MVNIGTIASAESRSISTNLLLDDYPDALGAYSLRKLRAGYTGSCIQLRFEGSVGNLSNIGFDANGVVDFAKIAASCSAFTPPKIAIVSTWYDQSGNDIHLPEGTNSIGSKIGPRIYSGSAFISPETGKPYVRFFRDNTGINSSLDYINTTSKNVLQSASYVSTFALYEYRISPPDATGIIELRDAASGASAKYRVTAISNKHSISSRLADGASTRYDITSSREVVLNTPLLDSSMISYGTSDGYQYINGDEVTYSRNYPPVPGNLTDRTTNYLVMGGNAAPRANISEIIVYQSNQKTNRPGIEDNINRYYNLLTGPQSTYLLTWQNGMINANTTGSISGIEFTPSAAYITVPPEGIGQAEYTVYSGQGPIGNNTAIIVTLNKGADDTGYTDNSIFYYKNGVIDFSQYFALSPGPDSYTFNITSAIDDVIEFYVTTYDS